MEKIFIGERPNYKDKLVSDDFEIFQHDDGLPYWQEGYAYRFSPKEIEYLEISTNELIGLCYEAVQHVVDNPVVLFDLAIPEDYHGAVIDSWCGDESELYGRFDLSLDLKTGIPKMLEFNADTPTSLYESAVIQWKWLEDQKKLGKIPVDADQFNSIHDRLIDAFRELRGNLPKYLSPQWKTLSFAAILEAPEDAMTVEYMADCAFQAGFDIEILNVKDLAYDENLNLFVNGLDKPIFNLFKLYPWEHMFREELGPKLLKSKTVMKEPMWKSILSNKGILPILWKMFPGHPNLLEAHFEKDWLGKGVYLPQENFVKKPLLSREGANITQLKVGSETESYSTGGEYGAEGYVYQKCQTLPVFKSLDTFGCYTNFACIGSWSVNGESAGICIREDESPITKNTSRFVPHFIS